MIPEIEQLLIIQDRDQKLKELNSDIERLPLEELQAKERLKAATTSVEISEKAFMENEIAMKNINHQLIGIGNIKDHYMGPKRLINFDE